MKKTILPIMLSMAIVALALPVLAMEMEKAGKEPQISPQIQQELKLITERKPQSKCPITGEALSGKDSVTYIGYEIGLCCPKCKEAVEKDPLSAIQKIRANGEEPKLAKGFKPQEICPKTGEKIDKAVFKIKNNMLVYFCCPACEADFLKEPEKVVKGLLDKGQAPVILTLKQTTCPVTGEPIDSKTSVVYKGKKVEFCCADCKAAFNKEPAKFLAKLADEGVVLENAK